MFKSANNPQMYIGLEDKPPPFKTLLIAMQHVLAVFGGIVTAPLIIALGMQLSLTDTAYLVSSSLVISGLATAIQIYRVGPIGSGLLSIQGTSFTFIGPLIFSYFTVLEGRLPEQALGLVLGSSGVCALCMMVFVQFIEKLQKWITCNVSGTTVILIGIALVVTTLKNLFNDFNAAKNGEFPAWWVLALASSVFVLTLMLARTQNMFLRIASITFGLVFGFGVAWILGIVDTSALNSLEAVFYPKIAYFPLGFDVGVFLMLMPIFFISSAESLGDLTATSKLSGLNIGDRNYWQRIRRGLSGDAFNSFMAAIFCSFPNTTFSQNNGVIRLTGVCSPRVGLYVAAILAFLGLFPIVGCLFVIMPAAVLCGATLLMFMMVVVSGIAVVNSGDYGVRSWWLVGFSIVIGLACSVVVPTLTFLPQWLITFLQFPISTGAICAFLGELIRYRLMLRHRKFARIVH